MRISSASPPPMSHNFSIEQCLPALEQLMGESAGTRSKRPGPSYFVCSVVVVVVFVSYIVSEFRFKLTVTKAMPMFVLLV